MTRGGAGAAALAAVLTLGACGTTYVESSASAVPADRASTTTLPPVDDAAPLADLLGDVETLLFDLEQRIIDERDAAATLARIDELWRVAERRIRDDDPDAVFNFEQAIELARTGVERRRPADASKAYKIFAQVATAHLA